MIDPKIAAHIEECKDAMTAHIERRINTVTFSEEQIEDIAEKAAEKALKKISDMAYREVGKSIVSKLLYIIGVLAVTAYLYLQSHGWVK